MPVDSNFNFEEFVKKCPSNLSGADFFAITNKSRQEALKRIITNCEEGQMNSKEQEIFITNEDFDKSLKGLRPTLSESALEEYKKYFKNYSNKNSG